MRGEYYLTTRGALTWLSSLVRLNSRLITFSFVSSLTLMILWPHAHDHHGLTSPDA